jgi:hypothetical protein
MGECSACFIRMDSVFRNRRGLTESPVRHPCAGHAQAERTKHLRLSRAKTEFRGASALREIAGSVQDVSLGISRQAS